MSRIGSTLSPGAYEVCVLCGGPVEDIEVDHWIAKSAYPLLSVCADNLLPICGRCNSTDNKGTKAVHSNGSFANWFHPYWRHSNGAIRLDYDLQSRSIVSLAVNPADVEKVANLDNLLNLSKRWTRKFKAEYINQQDELRRYEQLRKDENLPRFTQEEVVFHINTKQAVLSPTMPHYEVHNAVFSAMLYQARLDAWQTELKLVI